MQKQKRVLRILKQVGHFQQVLKLRKKVQRLKKNKMSKNDSHKNEFKKIHNGMTISLSNKKDKSEQKKK